MDVIYRRCAGLDVHKQTVVACARVAGQGPLLQEVRTFATTTSGLLELVDWLESLHIEHVGMVRIPTHRDRSFREGCDR